MPASACGKWTTAGPTFDNAAEILTFGPPAAAGGTGVLVARQQCGTEVLRTGERCVGQQACACRDGCMARTAHKPEAFRTNSAINATAKPVVDPGLIKRLEQDMRTLASIFANWILNELASKPTVFTQGGWGIDPFSPTSRTSIALEIHGLQDGPKSAAG